MASSSQDEHIYDERKAMYNNSIVVGKFCPLHKGHELLINAALNNSKNVMVISYTSKDYGYPAKVREHWLKSLFPTAKIVVVERGLPDDVDDGDVHREFCCKIMEQEEFIPDAIFSSEDYGCGFAAYTSRYFKMDVTHECVDISRMNVPISGTALRNQERGSEMWDKNTSTIVKSSPLRVMFIGPESSGKSTICTHMAKTTRMPCVDEYGRTLWEEQGGLEYSDMVKIARTQVANEISAMGLNTEIVFCDTSPLVTKFYSQEWYQNVDPELEELAERKYDIIFFCERDFGYIDDGTRNGVQFGSRQIEYYRTNLKQSYVRLSGSIQDREQMVLEVLRKTFPWVTV